MHITSECTACRAHGSLIIIKFEKLFCCGFAFAFVFHLLFMLFGAQIVLPTNNSHIFIHQTILMRGNKKLLSLISGVYARGIVYRTAYTQAIITISYHFFFVFHPTNKRTIYLLTMHVDTISGQNTHTNNISCVMAQTPAAIIAFRQNMWCHNNY